jgi:hypothetical protein
VEPSDAVEGEQSTRPVALTRHRPNGDVWTRSAAVEAEITATLRRFGPNPRPDFSGDFHPASREIKQERRPT